jgi:hypothetical protein
MINRSCEEAPLGRLTLLRILYGTQYGAEVRWNVPSRRLDDRIRELCHRVVSASAEEGELEPLIEDLKSALREHNSRLRKLAAAKLANPFPPRKEPVP